MLRSTRARALALTAAIMLLASTGRAQLRPLDSGSVVAAVGRLHPSQYLWLPELAPQGPMLVVVNLSTQRLVAYRNGVPIAASTISSGRPGHRTPAGVFTILQKAKWHRSSLYSNAPMPFMQRLTWYGIALHGGALPGYPASHGCIRLPHAFARLLFAQTNIGMTVVVTAQQPGLRVGSNPADARAYPAGPASWHPERAPSGPVSIIVSGADRRMVVLRNGIEIGSAPVSFDGEIVRAQAYVLKDATPGAYRWQRLALPGDGRHRAAEPEPAPHAQSGSDPFRRALADVLTPGATMVVVPDSIGAMPGHAEDPPVIEDAPAVEAWLQDASLAVR